MPLPTDPLSNEDQNHLLRIWKSNRRQLIDVKPSCETSEKNKIPDHAYRFTLRLYRFFLAVLARAQSSQDSRDSTSSFLKEPQESCLRDFVSVAFSQPDGGEVRLIKGRHVIALLHEDFLSELNQFELQGTPATQEFIRKDSFGAFLYHVPEDALTAVACGMRMAVLTLFKQTNQPTPQTTQNLAHFLDKSQLIVRFLRVQPQVQMIDVKTGLVGKFLTVKGAVVKAKPKQLRVATADFVCQKCGSLITHAFTEGRYSVPTKCYTEGCKSRSFTILRPTTRYTNIQQLRLQEAQEESTAHAGRTPRQIEVELTNDLVDICRPGDIVLVAAEVAAINTAVAAGRAGKRALENSTYKLYLRGHSVTTMSETNRQQTKTSQTIYTQQQLRSITQLCHADHRYFGLTERRAFPFDLLVRSLCPSIIGHNAVKAGLLLCLLGGTPPSAQASEKEHSIRSNSHCLIVGDPGMVSPVLFLSMGYCST